MSTADNKTMRKENEVITSALDYARTHPQLYYRHGGKVRLVIRALFWSRPVWSIPTLTRTLGYRMDLTATPRAVQHMIEGMIAGGEIARLGCPRLRRTGRMAPVVPHSLTDAATGTLGGKE